MYKLSIVFLVVITYLVMGEEEEPDPFIKILESLNNYISEEGKEVAEIIAEFMANLLDKLDDILVEMRIQNCASDSLKNYKDVVNLVKGSKCKVETPAGYEEAEETISSTADTCAYSISVDDLVTVIPEIGKIEKQLLDLDSKVNKIQNKEERKKVVKAIQSVFGTQEVTHLKDLTVLDIKKALDKCIKKTTKDLWTELDSSTKKLKDCLAKGK